MNELIRAALVALQMTAAPAVTAARTELTPRFAEWIVPSAVVVAPPAVQTSAVRTSAVITSAVYGFEDPKSDNWLGQDKFRHFWLSFATASFTFAALSAADVDTEAALTVAVPVSFAIGVGKEIHDRRRGEIFSARDLVADALGTAAAYFLLREVR